MEKKYHKYFLHSVNHNRPKVLPMMRTLSINRIKHHLPKWKVISFFLPLQQYIWLNTMSLYMLKKRVAWHPKERLPMKLADIKSENIEVYISFNNSIQGNGERLSEWDIGALTTPNEKMWQNIMSHNVLKKCVAWHPKKRLPMIDISSFRVRKYRSLSLIQ